jgi:hypothetical protein
VDVLWHCWFVVIWSLDTRFWQDRRPLTYAKKHLTCTGQYIVVCSCLSLLSVSTSTQNNRKSVCVYHLLDVGVIVRKCRDRATHFCKIWCYRVLFPYSHH